MAERHVGGDYKQGICAGPMKSHVRFPAGAKPPPPPFRLPKLKEQPGEESLKGYCGTGNFHGPVRWDTTEYYGNQSQARRPHAGKDAGSMDVMRNDTRPWRRGERPTGRVMNPVYDPHTFYGKPSASGS